MIYYRWVLWMNPKIKQTDEIFKPRLDAEGFQQRPDIDFTETLGPALTLSVISLLFAHTHWKGFQVMQCDLKNSFTDGTLYGTIFLKGS